MQNSIDQRCTEQLEKAVLLSQYTVYKQYLTELDKYPLVPAPQLLLNENGERCVRLLRLKEFAIKKGEDINQKLSTVYHASMALGCTLFVLIDVCGKDAPAKIYLGIRSSSENDIEINNLHTSFKTLDNSLQSNFPGTKTESIDQSNVPQVIDDIFGTHIKSISSVSCVASSRDKSKTENKSFIQGIERFIDTMRGNGRPYTALFISEPISVNEQAEIRNGYESIYSALSSFRKSTWSFNENESGSVMENLSEGISQTITEGTSHTQGHTKGIGGGVGFNGSRGRETSNSISSSSSKSSPTAISRLGQAIGSPAFSELVGTIAMAVTGGNVLIGAAVAGISQAAGAAMQGSSAAEAITSTIASGISKNLGINAELNGHYDKNISDSNFKSVGNSKTTTRTSGFTSTSGTGRTLQIENVNKSVDEMLKRIDEQLKRSRECEDYGAYNCGAYFLSAELLTSVLAANTYRALMLGDGSSVESGAINVWSSQNNVDTVNNMVQYLKRFVHPTFFLPVVKSPKTEQDIITYSPGTIVSGLELPLHLGIPTKSVYGLPVIERAEFGRNVEFTNSENSTDYIEIGKVFHMGSEESNMVKLDINSLSMHTFITGSTGTGKSNFIYNMLGELIAVDKKILVIEPAKGEYKNIFGGDSCVNVYGTNPKYTDLLHINPFSFPEHISVLEHIDRLVEIFNACWPMYAAMPALLKDGIEKVYKDKGWIFSNPNYYSTNFPTFTDLIRAMPEIMNNSLYSNDTKSDYQGALMTRIKSLTNGINGEIFCSCNEISNEKLFDENTIVDISRVGSIETKSLIMGIMIMKLQEYRMKSDKMNESLNHVTVIEEAHNLLRKTSFSQSQENSNLQGKSVEMLTNAIAEMRTYGEGFIIADQAPDLLDEAVIRNTNTKIIFRLPNGVDGKLVGQSIALNDEQIKELSKLPAYVCAVYQNNWLEAVLCKSIQYFSHEKYNYNMKDFNASIRMLMTSIFNLRERVRLSYEVKDELKQWIQRMDYSDNTKELLYKSLGNEQLDDQEKMILAYNLFGGNIIVRKLKNSLDKKEALDFVDDQICGTFSFEKNTRVVQQVKRYIFMAINSEEVLSDIASNYDYFGVERRIK